MGAGTATADEEDDVDVILAGVAAAGAADAVFRPQLPAAATEALLLLRNVCFHAEAKAHVGSNPRCIDALVAAAGAADPSARAAAADALLALVHNGQRVAASLRAGRRPRAPAARRREGVSRGEQSRRRRRVPRSFTHGRARGQRRRRAARGGGGARVEVPGGAGGGARRRRRRRLGRSRVAGQHAGGHRRRRPRRRGVLGRARDRAAVGVLIS